MSDSTIASRLWNADESGFQLNPSGGTVIALKGAKKVVTRRTEGGGQITGMVACSAAGKIARPLFIVPRNTVSNLQLTELAQKGEGQFYLTGAESTFITTEIFGCEIHFFLFLFNSLHQQEIG
jgi:hypothetical protein